MSCSLQFRPYVYRQHLGVLGLVTCDRRDRRKQMVQSSMSYSPACSASGSVAQPTSEVFLGADLEYGRASDPRRGRGATCAQRWSPYVGRLRYPPFCCECAVHSTTTNTPGARIESSPASGLSHSNHRLARRLDKLEAHGVALKPFSTFWRTGWMEPFEGIR